MLIRLYDQNHKILYDLVRCIPPKLAILTPFTSFAPRVTPRVKATKVILKKIIKKSKKNNMEVGEETNTDSSYLRRF